MAFINKSDIQAALDSCTTVEEWDNFTGSVQTPEELVSYSLQKFADISTAAITFEVS